MATMTVASEFGTRTMNATYNVSGGSLVLKPEVSRNFGGRQPFNGTYNGTRPYGNGTYNGTRPYGNGTRPYGNGTYNGTRQPFNRSQMTMTLTYRFDESGTVLYLNNVAFTKVS